MRPFHTLYNKVLDWSSSRFAIFWLSLISFLESSILPYPIQDLLLASMSLKNRSKAFYFATICTISSVLGAVAGYYIGIYAINLIAGLAGADYIFTNGEVFVIWILMAILVNNCFKS